MAAKLTDSQNTDTTALSGRELYHLKFSGRMASPETFGYTCILLMAENRKFIVWLPLTLLN
jgi:hypothetical protein